MAKQKFKTEVSQLLHLIINVDVENMMRSVPHFSHCTDRNELLELGIGNRLRFMPISPFF